MSREWGELNQTFSVSNVKKRKKEARDWVKMLRGDGMAKGIAGYDYRKREEMPVKECR